MTEKQAAEYSGFTVSALRKWRRLKKGFPFIKSNDTGFIRYSKTDIDRYMEANTHGK